jgi:hypothetical protein
MTFKNLKFDESPVMRSLERVAIAKGMVKPEALKKEASAPIEQDPNTLSEKILKLCEELRSNGMETYANDVEVKFLMYKKAENSLYDVFKEEGKDLVEFAHPDGGNKLDKGWSDLGLVETITEKHQKIVDVINKQPKGKLASKNIINTVKIVLAQTAPSDPYAVAMHAFDNFRKVFKHAAGVAGLDADYGDNWFEPLEKLLQEKDAAKLAGYFSGPAGTNLMETWIKNLKDEAEPGVLFDSFGPRQNNWRKIVYADLDGSALKYANLFEDAIKSIISSGQEAENKSIKSYDPETDDVEQKTQENQLTLVYNNIMQTITGLKNSITSKKLGNAEQLLATLDQFNQYIMDEKKDFDALDEAQKATSASQFAANTKEVQNRLNAFKTKWGL